MGQTRILKCVCTPQSNPGAGNDTVNCAAAQFDAKYGQGYRLHNVFKGGKDRTKNVARCIVCGKEKDLS
jgi:hypothetical protein